MLQPVGRAAPLAATDQLLLAAQGIAVPRLDMHPDPSSDEIGATLHPLLVTAADEDVLVERGGVLAREVVGAVLETKEVSWSLRRWRGGGGLAETELAPPHADSAETDTRKVAHCMHRDLRIIRAGLHADVAVGTVGIEKIPRKVRELNQSGRTFRI